MLHNMNFINTIVAATLALPMVLFTADSALADKDNFRVYNRSRYDIVRLHITSSDYGQWGPDILGNGILRSGYNMKVGFNDMSNNRCLYDIKAVFEDGEVVIDSQVNVCNSDGETFYDQ